MKLPEALVFDVDGTLADTEREGHRVAFNIAFEKAGLDWDWSESLYGQLLAVTGGKERIRYYLDHYNTAFKRPADMDDFLATLHKAKNGYYAMLLKSGDIPLRSGVRRLLQEARAKGLRLAIATTTSPENVTALLENTLGPASLQWFEVIAAGDIVPAKKPAPDIYEYALKELSLAAAACLAFEDSENGIRSSVEAGLKTVVTVNDYTKDHDFSGAVLVVDQLGEADNPFQVISGDANGARVVDLDLLKRL